MKRFYLSNLILVTLLLGSNFITNAQTTNYTIPGAYVYTVPAGVTLIGIDLAGGAGGLTASPAATGGAGGRAQGTLAVTPGQLLYVYVGAKGAAGSCGSGGAGGSSYGGGEDGGAGSPSGCSGSGGGAASDIRTIPGTTLAAMNSRLIVGAGGGGSAWGCSGDNGGGGGGATGLTGLNCGAYNASYCGTPGTSSAPGSAATFIGTASPGGFGPGGNAYNFEGGGGGGGWYGAGGASYGGACGGSSYFGGAGVTAGSTTQAYNPSNGYVNITVLCSAPGTVVGTLVACVGASTTLTNPTAAGGVWLSSNPAVATVGTGTGIVTGVSAGTAIITYNEANPCGGVSATATVTINPLPGTITGSGNVCFGQSTTLSDAASGGTWTSSNPAVGSISTAGIVAGLTPGTTTITYTLPTTCSITTTVTVNPLPPLNTVTGGGQYCVGGVGVHVGLNGSSSGINYQVIFGGSPVASVGGSGTALDFGLFTAAGTYTVLATDMTTGCTKNMTGSAVVVINPLPAGITGTSNVCVGGTSTLSDATPGGSWSSGNPAIAAIVPGSGLVTGVVSGIVNITYTLGGTGCATSIPFLVNALPGAITGITNLCIGTTTILSGIPGGGSWTSASPFVATVASGTGVVTGVSSGTSVITYTLGSGCSRNVSVVVNPLPTAYGMTGGGTYCNGGLGVHVGIVYSSSGVNYQLMIGGSPVGAALPGSNSGLDFGLRTTPGVYTVTAINPITNCTNSMTGSVTVGVNPLPGIENMTGGGSYCSGGSGIAIGLDHSLPGINYQLFNGTTAVGPVVAGTGAAVTFGLYTTAGTYSATATNAVTGCGSNMNGSATITINPLPTAYAVTGGGHYCAGTTGVHIGLSGSDPGTSYSLFRGTVFVTSVTGAGVPIDFGIFTTAGVYTVNASDGSSCSNNMIGSATVTIDPLPVVYGVTGGGGYCIGGAGVHVGLGFSSTGIDYQLWYGGSNIATVHGSGSGLDFGIQSGSGIYSVIAVNVATGCTVTMSGSASITVNLPPNGYSVTGGGNYCIGTTGVHIGTNLSDPGTNYQLYRGTTPVGAALPGTSAPLDFGTFISPGTYTVLATIPGTGCNTLQVGSATVGVSPLPLVYSLSGGGNICVLSLGADIVLSNSEMGVNYELFIGTTTTGTILSGTGSALHFGLQTVGGVYTVVATNTTTGCMKNMSGSATITINPLPNLFNVTGGGHYCSGGTGVHIGLDGSNTSINYQLKNGSGSVGSAMAGSGTVLDFGLKTVPGAYWVEATNPLTGCVNTMTGTGTISIDPLPNDFPIIGGGPYCAGSGGDDISIGGSEVGFSYQLYRSGTPVGIAHAGTGSAIDFGVQAAAGVYTVKSTNDTTGCSKNMPGTAVVTIISNSTYAVTGGGNFCAGGTGVHVGLSGSQSGVDYQLWISSGSIGAVVHGTGSSIDFGLQTTGDIYKVIATNATYFCFDTMAGIATVNINPLPALQTVNGGGSYCFGGGGRHIGLILGDAGINYQLYNGSSAVGAPVPGGASALDFGLETVAGTYTVIGSNITTGCSNTMSGSAIITIKPLPAAYRDSVTGENPAYPGYFCATDTGVHIYLKNSDAGIKYQLWRGTTMIGSPVFSAGGILDMGLQVVAGTYTITAEDTATTCTNNMLGSAAVHIVNLPNVHNVTGGGIYCPGGTGLHVGLDGSDPGFTYQLFDGPYSAGSILYGTGAPLDFGVMTASGTYTIVGNNVITTCLNNMFGGATIAFDSILTPHVMLRAFPGTGVGVWHIDSIRADVSSAGTNPTYQWSINGNDITGATNASFTNHEFFNNDLVACTVTASGPCGGYSTIKSLVLELHNVRVNSVGGSNAEISLVPNPNRGVFTVKGTLGTNVDEEVLLEITNMLGQVVYTNRIMPQNGNIDEHIQLGSNLANGMYMLNLRSGTQHSVFHFVIEQ